MSTCLFSYWDDRLLASWQMPDSIFPASRVLVVTRDDDQLQAPDGLLTVLVSQFVPEAGVEYIVIANGGTSAQLVSVLKKLIEAGASLKVFDLQRDGISQLW